MTERLDGERRRTTRRFQDLLRVLEQHDSARTDVGMEIRSELIRRGIRIPSGATALDLIGLVIDAEAPYVHALKAERRIGERRRI